VPRAVTCASCGTQLPARRIHPLLVVLPLVGCFGLMCLGMFGLGIASGVRTYRRLGIPAVQEAVSAAANAPVRVSAKRRPINAARGLEQVLIISVGKTLTPDEERSLAQTAWNAIPSPDEVAAVCISSGASTGRIQIGTEHCFLASDLRGP
jgi:hypothetical protein